MKLSKRQAKALKTWCKDAVIEYAEKRWSMDIGSQRTIQWLYKRGLIAPDWNGGYATALYQLTSSGVDELRRRGFFTRPPGAKT